MDTKTKFGSKGFLASLLAIVFFIVYFGLSEVFVSQFAEILGTGSDFGYGLPSAIILTAISVAAFLLPRFWQFLKKYALNILILLLTLLVLYSNASVLSYNRSIERQVGDLRDEVDSLDSANEGISTQLDYLDDKVDDIQDRVR